MHNSRVDGEISWTGSATRVRTEFCLKTAIANGTLLITAGLITALLIGGCATAEHRDPLDDLHAGYGLDSARLLTYYHLALAAWREQDEYRDTGWELSYFGAEETNTLGVAYEHSSRLIVAFRGSQLQRSDIDRRLNFRFFPKRLPFDHTPERVRVHRGFLEKYLSVRDDLHALVRSSNRPEVTVVGHSGGGALASLAYFDLKRAFPQRRVRAITYGMPRVFNRIGAEIINRERSRFLRVVNGDDIVPQVPFRAFGFRHVGTELELTPGRWYRPFSQYDHHPGYRKELEARSGTTEPWHLGHPDP